MERLIPANKQSRRSLGIKDRPHPFCDLVCPIVCSTFGRYPQIEVLRRYKHSVCILEATPRDTIDPYCKCFSAFFERRTSLRGGANKVCDCETTCPNHLIAEPTHSPSVLDP